MSYEQKQSKDIFDLLVRFVKVNAIESKIVDSKEGYVESDIKAVYNLSFHFYENTDNKRFALIQEIASDKFEIYELDFSSKEVIDSLMDDALSKEKTSSIPYDIVTKVLGWITIIATIFLFGLTLEEGFLSLVVLLVGVILSVIFFALSHIIRTLERLEDRLEK